MGYSLRVEIHEDAVSLPPPCHQPIWRRGAADDGRHHDGKAQVVAKAEARDERRKCKRRRNNDAPRDGASPDDEGERADHEERGTRKARVSDDEVLNPVTQRSDERRPGPENVA